MCRGLSPLCSSRSHTLSLPSRLAHTLLVSQTLSSSLTACVSFSRSFLTAVRSAVFCRLTTFSGWFVCVSKMLCGRRHGKCASKMLDVFVRSLTLSNFHRKEKHEKKGTFTSKKKKKNFYLFRRVLWPHCPESRSCDPLAGHVTRTWRWRPAK